MKVTAFGSLLKEKCGRPERNPVVFIQFCTLFHGEYAIISKCFYTSLSVSSHLLLVASKRMLLLLLPGSKTINDLNWPAYICANLQECKR